MRRWLVVTIVVTLFTVVTSNYPHAVAGPARETPTTLLEKLANLEHLENPATLENPENFESFESFESFDFYGNRIQSAVATYGFDASGTLYDVQAPQVDLPHLDRPST